MYVCVEKLKYQIIIEYYLLINNDMEHFVNFYNNGYLFKCEPQEFDTTIQNVFNDIFSLTITDDERNELINMTGNDSVKKCMICNKYIGTMYFTICKKCAKKCVGYDVNLQFSSEHLSPTCYMCCLHYAPETVFNELFSDSLEYVLNYIENLRDHVCFGCETQLILNNCVCSLTCYKKQVTYKDVDFRFALCNGKYILSCVNIHGIENNFISKLPKLYDDYFKTTSIILIMALNDVSSPINMLVYDIVTHIFQFIY